MVPLSPIDQMFLLLEKRQQPMHVASLMLFDYPEDAGDSYVSDIADYLRTLQHPEGLYAQKLTSSFGQYYWEEDRHFDLDHHFRHEALPAPGRIRELLARISTEHSNLMDRERPMWEFHLIEGLCDRQFAIYSKVHHCMMDGIAAVRSSLQSLTVNPTVKQNEPWWMLKQSKDASSESDDAITSVAELLSNAGRQISTVPTVARELFKNINLTRKKTDHVSIFQAPNSILNQPITGSRRFAAQSYSLDRFKKIGKGFDATINDVVLSVCGSALRDYLISHHALPDKPLIAMVPMSMRNKSNDGFGGNQVASILVNLGTHVADPVMRMEMVKASVAESKNRFQHLSVQEAMNYIALSMAPAGLNMLTGIIPKWNAFNVIISNVPGPRTPMYWNGGRLKGYYPISIPVDRVALNITLFSYGESIEFGFTACRRTMPSMQRLLDYIERGLQDLEVALDFPIENERASAFSLATAVAD